MTSKVDDYTILKGKLVYPSLCYLMQFDGKAEPNPGSGSSGTVLYSPIRSKGEKFFRKKIIESGDYLNYCTNNQAEYEGLILGLTKAFEYDVNHLVIEGDSNLIINQMIGSWKVKDDKLKLLYERATTLVDLFDFVAIKHVYRTNNIAADKVTNIVHDAKQCYEKVY